MGFCTCQCCGDITDDPEKWQAALDVLVDNSVNLMQSIGKLIEEAQVAAVKSKTKSSGRGDELLAGA